MISLFSPLRQNEALLGPLQEKLRAVLSSGEYVLGREVDQFEKRLAEKLGWGHAVGCSSGTDALILALKALDLAPGDEVVTPAYSFVASANVVAWAGLKPVFADVSPDTGCLTVGSVERVLTARTRAIIAVDLYGRQAPVLELRRLAEKYGLYIVEDGAQSIGVPSHRGNGAHLYTTSFYPTKNLGAMGDGGAVLTDDPQLATAVREMSRHGGLVRDHYTRVGTTARLDTLQAAFLAVKLPHLDTWTAQRRTIAAWYLRHLKPLEDQGKLRLPTPPPEPKQHVWALFAIRLPHGRDELAAQLRAKGVGCGIYYPRALPKQPALAGWAQGEYPGAETLARESLCLPIYPELTAKEFEKVVMSVAECVGPMTSI